MHAGQSGGQTSVKDDNRPETRVQNHVRRDGQSPKKKSLSPVFLRREAFTPTLYTDDSHQGQALTRQESSVFSDGYSADSITVCFEARLMNHEAGVKFFHLWKKLMDHAVETAGPSKASPATACQVA